MRRSAPSPWFLVAGLTVTLWSIPTRADEGADSKAVAQALFDEGRALVAHQQFAEACPKFAESQRLDPGIGTELWLADCYENNGQIASAWVSFKEAAAAAALVHDKRESVARDRASVLEAKMPRMMIVVADAAASQGIEVRRDGVIVSSTVWGFPVPLDPGVHTIAASAAGHKPWSTTVQVAERPDTLQVTIPALDELPQVGAPEPTATPVPATEAAESPPVREGSGNGERIAGAIIAGAGAIGVGVGTFFSFDAKSTYDASNQGGHCLANNECDAAGKQDRDQANQKALVATLAMGIGAAAVVGGGIMYFLAPRGPSAAVSLAAQDRGAAVHFRIDW